MFPPGFKDKEHVPPWFSRTRRTFPPGFKDEEDVPTRIQGRGARSPLVFKDEEDVPTRIQGRGGRSHQDPGGEQTLEVWRRMQSGSTSAGIHFKQRNHLKRKMITPAGAAGGPGNPGNGPPTPD